MILIILLIYTWLGVLINSAMLGREGGWLNGIELFSAIVLWMPLIIINILAIIFKKHP